MTTKNALYLFTLVLILVALFVYFVYLDKKDTEEELQRVDIVKNNVVGGEEPEAINTINNEEILQDASGSIEFVEAEPVSQVVLPPAPQLDGPIIIPDSFSAEFKEKTTKEIGTLLATLKQNPGFFNGWIDLGLLFKVIEDYDRARQAWEYAGIVSPQNSLSYTNLGVVYGYYLKDPVLAEKNYLKAIENGPLFTDLYIRASNFYLEILKDNEKAEETLNKGLEKLPEDESLKAALELLKSLIK